MKFKTDFPPTNNQLETQEKEGLSWFDSYVLQNEKFKIPKSTFPRPFMVQMKGNQYGILKEGNLYITNPEDFNDVKNTFYDYELVTKEMDSRVNNGNHYDPIHVDYMRDTLNKINKIFEKSEKISPYLISRDNFKKDPEKMYEEFKDYLILIEENNREKVEDYFNLKFDALSTREQFYFLNLIKDKNSDEIIPIKKFTDKFETNGFRTFLSIEQDEEMGDKIFILGEKLPKESAKALFSKYGEIIDEVDNIGGYIEKSTKGQVGPEIINKAKENLLIKGKDLLSRYADKANTCIGDECINIGKELEEKLLNIKASLMLFASACKSLSEENMLSIEDLANTELEIIHGGIDENTQEEMKRIFKENRPNYSAKLLEDVSSEFEVALKDPKENQTFYILRNNNEIASFMRLDELEDGSIYGASFNVRTELRGSSIGTELMKKIVVKESSKKTFKILCYDKNPMLEKYKTEFGFNIVGEIDNYHNTGEKFYKMERSPSSNQ